MRHRPLKRLLAGALALIVTGCLWFYFAPIPLGGSTSYVITHGVSMEPLFHTGDLAIVRSKPSYRVGEIVAYHNKMLHTVVLHRIIGRDGQRYIFKGDNNNFIDPEHPRASQLIGGLWIHIAGAGTRLKSFSSPVRAGLLVAIGMLLLTAGVFARRRRRRRRERRAGGVASAPGAPRTLPLNPSEPAVAILALGILALLPFLLLALLAFTRVPATRHAAKIPYEQSGSLAYSAKMAPNPVYPEGVVTTGEPLFTTLVNSVNLRFDYTFATKATHSFKGKGSFMLVVAASDGWHRTLPLGSPTYFRGDHAVITSTLSTSSLLALMRSIEAATGIQGSYEVALVPTVVANGSIEDVPFRATFSPAINFSVSRGEIDVAGHEGAVDSATRLLSGGNATAAAPLPAILRPSAPGSVTREQSTPKTLALGPWRVSVSTARTIALSAIGIILAAIIAALALIQPMLALMAPRRRDEVTSILARYRGLIVPVAQITPLRGVQVIDVADMDALARIAEHYDRSILHETTAAGDAFWVADESGQFRYTIGAPATSVNGRSAAPAPSTNGQTAEPASPAQEPAAAPTSTGSEHTVAPSWSRNDQAVPAWTETGQLVATAVATNGDEPTLVHATTPERPATEAVTAPALAWSDTNPMPTTAAFDTAAAPVPATPAASPFPAADSSGHDQIPTPEWAESGHVSAPAWDQDLNRTNGDDRAAELLAPTMYVGELEHPGPFAAPQWQPMPEHATVASSTDSGWVPLSDHAWGAEADALAREGASWQPASAADAELAPTGASVASFTGLEWTTNS